LYDGPVGSSGVQRFDFNPGIIPFPNGVFWTVAIPDQAVTSRSGRGEARLFVEDLRLFDMHDIATALSRNTGDAAVATFDVQWTGGGDRVHVRDETFGFDGRFITGEATVHWDATNLTTGFHFQSDPAGQFVVNGASHVGRERNGAFFH